MNIRICFMVLSLFGFRAFAVEPAQPNPHPAELVMKSYLEAELESASLFEFCARTRPLVVKVEDYPECPPHETSEIVRRNPLEVSCEAKHEEYRCTIRYTVVASGGIQAGGESAWIIRPEPRRLVTTKTFIMRKRDEWKISDPYAAPHVASDTLLKRLLLEKQAPSSTARIKAIDASITKLHELMSYLGVVPQESVLFSGSILENLLVASPQATFAQVVEACKLAETHETVESMAEGYQTVIGERGSGLTGGQRQQLAIA